MTGYSTDLTQILTTVAETLHRRVLSDLPDGPARLELAAVLEQLDNLTGRIDWDAEHLATICARTENLARTLGLPPHEDPPGVDTLRQRRAAVSAVLAATYRDNRTAPNVIADAVAEFTAEDVADQITGALRGAFAPTKGDDR
ncbi:hypothetical protein [Nocardia miyunensis]|uniref:hypothetical protein n=1 Tax=Nocardia miyunensis TaxID=282684 RepID=UPI000831DB60|nr:hypothetical protein [Nocardia miyunensis]